MATRPLCVGIESSAATGWPFTDWVEELILRDHGIDFYNQWVAHEIPFNSPEIVETFQQVDRPVERRRDDLRRRRLDRRRPTSTTTPNRSSTATA